jgi:predicted amidophosphoribosyltransferase
MILGRICADAGRKLLDAVLPPLCLGCNEIVATPGALCAACWPGFSFIAPPHCARCGTPFAEDLGEGALCGACLALPPRFRRARAALVYDAQSRGLVLPFKHGDRTDLARACATGWRVPASSYWPRRISWRRSRCIAGVLMRRYNQALLLARSVTRQVPEKLAPDLLRRRRWTGSQAGLKAKERRSNVRQAFDIHPRWAGALEGKAVQLVDDVLTTGATVDACVRTLERGGAGHVDVLTLARVVRPAL